MDSAPARGVGLNDLQDPFRLCDSKPAALPFLNPQTFPVAPQRGTGLLFPLRAGTYRKKGRPKLNTSRKRTRVRQSPKEKSDAFPPFCVSYCADWALPAAQLPGSQAQEACKSFHVSLGMIRPLQLLNRAHSVRATSQLTASCPR